MDLGDWFAGRGSYPWGKLVRMTDQLPPHSRFKAAMMDDDELAAIIGLSDDDESSKKQKVSLAEYDPLVAKLTDVCDLLIGVRTTLIAVNSEKGKGPRDVKFMPRPETAFDRLRRVTRERKISELKSVLVPGE